LLRVRKDGVTVGEIALHKLVLQLRISALLGIVVNRGVHPVPGIQSDWGDPVAALYQKLLRLPPGFKIAANVQKRMPKVAKLHVVLSEQQANDVLAVNHIILPSS
jgi:hypothetical protein